MTASPPLLLVLITDHITTPSLLRAAFLRLLQGAHSLYESGTQTIQQFEAFVEEVSTESLQAYRWHL
jgi:hypothetical protein